MSDRIYIELERARVAIEHGQREACDSQIDAAGGEDNASCVGPPPSLDDALDAVAKLRNALASEGGGTDTAPNAQSVGNQLQPEGGEGDDDLGKAPDLLTKRCLAIVEHAEQLREFDAWLSFRPEFAEVLKAFRSAFFRSAFGTDMSAIPAPEGSEGKRLKDERDHIGHEAAELAALVENLEGAFAKLPKEIRDEYVAAEDSVLRARGFTPPRREAR